MKFNRNAFLMYFSGFTAEFPVLVSQFEEIYQNDKSRFYALACKNPCYRNSFLNDGTLIQDVVAKRIFGVYLAADEDELLYKRVRDILLDFEPRFETFLKARLAREYEKIKRIYSKIMTSREYTSSAGKASFAFYALHYLSEKPSDELVGDVLRREDSAPAVIKNQIEQINPFDYIAIEPSDWKIIKQVVSFDEIDMFLKIPEMLMGHRDQRELRNQHLFLAWEKDMMDHIKESDWNKMLSISSFLVTILQYHGVSIAKLFQNIRLSKGERDLILKTQAFCKRQVQIAAEQQDEIDMSAYTQPMVTMPDYYIRFLFYLLVKNLVGTKQFYYENNNETLFSQVSVYREENERLIEELEEAKKKAKQEKAQSELLRRQIVEKTQYLSKDEKELLKPYQEEISLLRKQIASLETALEEEREKDSELHALREFAFEAKSEYVSTGSKTSLPNLIKQKKLVVIGGHIEWRNKLKAKHPNIIVVDGHSAGSDFGMLANADMVLLNVSNMSHSVYYKAIDILRGNKIRFDYLGRTINQELYEQEIVSILEKHGF